MLKNFYQICLLSSKNYSNTVIIENVSCSRLLRAPRFDFSKFNCHHCEKKLEIPECKACQRMVSYFQIFHIPQNYDIDMKSVKNTAKDLQKQFHPDKYAQLDNSSISNKMVRYSAYINEAKATLLNDLQRAIYLMRLRGMDLEEDLKVDDSAFMMEIFEIQEEIQEATSEAAWEIKERLQKIIGELQKNIEKFFKSQDLQKCREFVIKYRYIECALLKARQKATEGLLEAVSH